MDNTFIILILAIESVELIDGVIETFAQEYTETKKCKQFIEELSNYSENLKFVLADISFKIYFVQNCILYSV